MIAVAAIRLSDLFAVVMLFGVYSLLTAALFMDLDAVDVAFTEAAVGAGVTTVLMLSSLHLTKRWEVLPRRKPLLGLLVIGMFLMAFNVWMTVRGRHREETPAPATPRYSRTSIPNSLMQ